MLVTSPCQNLAYLSLSDKIVQSNLVHIKKFVYLDNSGRRYTNETSFAPIATLKMQKDKWNLDKAKYGIDLMQKTFALLLAYSPNQEQIDLTFTPTADACFHAFLEINPLWNQFKSHIGREIYHYPFVYGEKLEGLRNTTAQLFMYHFGENPFEHETASSCSSCCLDPNPPMPIPDGW
jgi:hypothetical protein